MEAALVTGTEAGRARRSECSAPTQAPITEEGFFVLGAGGGPGSAPRFRTVDRFQLQCLVRTEVVSRWLFWKNVSALSFIFSFYLKFLNFL